MVAGRRKLNEEKLEREGEVETKRARERKKRKEMPERFHFAEAKSLQNVVTIQVGRGILMTTSYSYFSSLIRSLAPFTRQDEDKFSFPATFPVEGL